MNNYFSTFASGLAEIVKKALKKEIKDLKIKLILDGLIVYETSQEIEQIKKLLFLNNSFLLLSFFSGLKINPLGEMADRVLHNPNLIDNLNPSSFKSKSTFRIIFSDENQIMPTNKVLLKKLEEVFQKRTGWEINRSNPEHEIWFLSRSEGESFIGLRLTKTPNYEKTLYKGELRPELANIMCLLAELKETDIIFDPFAGYGAIVFEAARSFKTEKILAAEKDPLIFQILQEKAKKIRREIILKKKDSLNLDYLKNSSVDKIMTDPPWGFYEKIKINLEEFYRKMIKEFIRVLKPEGIIIILMAQKDLFENVLSEFLELKIIEKYAVLVSGKKASIYKIKKLI